MVQTTGVLRVGHEWGTSCYKCHSWGYCTVQHSHPRDQDQKHRLLKQSAA